MCSVESKSIEREPIYFAFGCSTREIRGSKAYQSSTVDIICELGGGEREGREGIALLIGDSRYGRDRDVAFHFQLQAVACWCCMSFGAVCR